MATTTSRRIAAIVGTSAFALALAGCTDSAPEAEPVSESPSSTPVSTPAPTAGADQAAALDAYLVALQGQVPALIDSFDGAYSDIRVWAEAPGTLGYDYVFAEQLDAAAAEQAFVTLSATLATACETVALPELQNAGITVDAHVAYTFYNADGSEIASHTC